MIRSKQLILKRPQTGICNLFKRAVSTFIESEAKPQDLDRTSEEDILKRPWATSPFKENSELKMPIFSLTTGEYTGESVVLDHKHFNLPLRRDLVHSLVVYESKYGLKTYKTTLTKGTVAGSGKKPFPQKGRGKARQGNKRSPIFRGGGKAHGKVPRDFTIDINDKFKLKAQKTLLSALLYENRVIFIDSEEIETHKTKFLHAITKGFNKNKLLFLTPKEACNNFTLASGNIDWVKVINSTQFNARDVTNTDFLLITKQGLTELETIFEGCEHDLYRIENTPKEEMEHDRLLGRRIGKKPDFFEEAKKEFEQLNLDMDGDFKIYSKALHGYVDRAKEYSAERDRIQDSEDMLWVNKESRV